VKKCYCVKNRIATCGDCGAREFLFTLDELEMIQNGLSLYQYQDPKTAKNTMRTAEKLNAKIWKMREAARKDSKK